MSEEIKAPDWWPTCPWHEEVWTMTMDQLKQRIARIIPNEDTRTSVCGVLMREGWRLCEKHVLEEMARQKRMQEDESNWQSFLTSVHPDAIGMTFENAPGSMRNEFNEWRCK